MVSTSILICACLAGGATKPDPVQTYVDGLNKTGFSILAGRLAAEKSGNAVVSPFSVATAHLMLAYGCKGAARNDLLKGMSMAGLGDDTAILTAAGLQSQMVRGSGNRFLVANAFATIRGEKPVPAFKKTIQSAFGGEYFDVERSRAVAFINQWVASKTKNRISRIVTDVPRELAMLLMNAATYDGEWKTPFQRNFRKTPPDANFTGPGGKRLSVDMMSRGPVATGWVSQKRFDAATLPYKDGAYAMLVAVPKEGVSVREVVKAIGGNGWKQTLQSLKSEKVLVGLPRFTDRTKTNLVSALKGLGVTRVFKPFDAGNMVVRGKGLFVGMDVHEAMIEVDRLGTKAGAATVIGMTRGRQPVPPKRLYADRPFLYALYHVKTGAIAFLGVCSTPPDWRPSDEKLPPRGPRAFEPLRIGRPS